MKLIIRNAWDRDGYAIWIYKESVFNKAIERRLIKPLNLELSDPVGNGFLLPEPTMFLSRLEFEELKTSIKIEGIANSIFKDPSRVEGELEATKEHLKDLQKLIFDGNDWAKGKL